MTNSRPAAPKCNPNVTKFVVDISSNVCYYMTVERMVLEDEENNLVGYGWNDCQSVCG